MRPNARRSDARKVQAARKAKVGGPTLPPVVLARITEAGASAYQWRDSLLMDLYRPPQSIQVALRVAYWVAQALAVLAVILVAHADSLTLTLAALALPVVAAGLSSLAHRRPSAPPSVVWVVSAGIAAIPMISSGAWGALGVVVLALAVVFSAEREHPVRAEISAWSSIVSTLAFGALAHATNMGWGVPLAWTVLLVLVQTPICLFRRSLKTVNHRISTDDLTARIPPPEFKWEPLAATVRQAARAVEAIPGAALVASAFPASAWLEGIIDGPSDAVMTDALKKSAGGYGERKTGIFLLGLAPGEGTTIFHDVVLPGAQSANIDHVVIGKNKEGNPCAFIIDSKFYGLSRLQGNDPGEVTYDHATGGYVHRQGARSRQIDQSIRTALWGAEAVQKVTDIEDVRVIMAIHNADVAPHLAFERDGVPVEIVSAWSLVARIEGRLYPETPLLTKVLRRGKGALTPLQEAKVSHGFVSASTGHRPMAVAPLGLSRRARDFMSQQTRQAMGEGVPSQFGPSGPDGYGEATMGDAPVRQSSPSEPPYPQAVPQGPSEPAPSQETPFQVADREFFQGDPSEWADDSPPSLPVAPAQSAPERVEGRWDEMRNSVPAALDDVPPEFHRVVRGTPLAITSFSEERGPVARDAVAITGVCVGSPGNLFLWYCSVDGWEQFRSSGTPVFISTIEIGSVVVRGGGE